ncbi:hypothetical protein B296_00005090 [Ensete ventricosum]|uniref:Uncharacterized protein n=1 Tax=Ensete ventricosum TaxID=4639 RepID=A0A426Z9I4_ENSVE|nr:hypothetical protein B296_00005090 [Ensete ventricosum]
MSTGCQLGSCGALFSATVFANGQVGRFLGGKKKKKKKNNNNTSKSGFVFGGSDAAITTGEWARHLPPLQPNVPELHVHRLAEAFGTDEAEVGAEAHRRHHPGGVEDVARDAVHPPSLHHQAPRPGYAAADDADRGLFNASAVLLRSLFESLHQDHGVGSAVLLVPPLLDPRPDLWRRRFLLQPHRRRGAPSASVGEDVHEKGRLADVPHNLQRKKEKDRGAFATSPIDSLSHRSSFSGVTTSLLSSILFMYPAAAADTAGSPLGTSEKGSLVVVSFPTAWAALTVALVPLLISRKESRRRDLAPARREQREEPFRCFLTAGNCPANPAARSSKAQEEDAMGRS